MVSTEDQVQELAGNQPMIMYRLDQADEHRDKIDEALKVLPAITTEQLGTHERLVALEKAVNKQAAHQGGSKKRQIGALAGVGVTGLGLGQVDSLIAILAKYFGAG